MNRATYEAMVGRLQEVNAVVETLDESIRADAFSILRPYVDGKSAGKVKHEEEDADTGDASEESVDTSSAEAFVRSQKDVRKPAEAAKAIAAWWFGEYGSAAIKKEDIKRIAGEIGVTIPGRPDNTLRALKSAGKPVYRVSKRGAFVPTAPHGELFFQNEYKVKKGRKATPAKAS